MKQEKQGWPFLCVWLVFWKQVTPYAGQTLSGKVIATFARGREVFREGYHAPRPCGTPLLPVHWCLTTGVGGRQTVILLQIQDLGSELGSRSSFCRTEIWALSWAAGHLFTELIFGFWAGRWVIFSQNWDLGSELGSGSSSYRTEIWVVLCDKKCACVQKQLTVRHLVVHPICFSMLLAYMAGAHGHWLLQYQTIGFLF